jgi:recombination protein RecT
MNTSVAAPEKSPIAAFSNFMDKVKPQLALALPKHLTADRMARLALTAFSTSPKLQECDPKSIAASIMTAGQLGLEPGVNGAGYLIPYGRTCTFVPGWKGLVDLVSRSGRGTVFTGVIFKDQQYTFTDGARRDLIIHNETDLDDPADITHAYAIGWVKDSSMPVIELWTIGKIRKHRDKYNKVGKMHYSHRDWEMYCRKVPLLQVLKYMPCSVEMSNALAINNASEAGRGATIEDGIIVDAGGQFGNNAELVGEEPPEEKKKLPACTEEIFAKMCEDTLDKDSGEVKKFGWKSLVTSKQKTAEHLLDMLSTKYEFSDAQREEIQGWGTL